MRIILHNPHSLWFKENLTCFFSKTKSINKYDFIFDYLYKNERTVYVYIDNVYSAPLFVRTLKFLNFPIIEFYAWVLLNKLNPFKFKIIPSTNDFSEHDVFFTFLYSSFVHADKDVFNYDFIKKIRSSKALKVVHLSHFGYKTKLASQLTEQANIDVFISESNLTKSSSYFQKYFQWYKRDVIILPFVPQLRFQNKFQFKDRINKVLSTGTNTQKMKEVDFIDFFKTDILQPMRAEIIKNKEILNDYIDPLVNNLQISSTPEVVNNKNNYLSSTYLFFNDFFRLFRLLSKSLFNINIEHLKNDSSYYKVDIVEKYNTYKMFIVPEEIIGVPGIGFIEGMSCGSAYIGVDGPMYRDLGLVAGQHFISYDGTLEHLIQVINYYQNNQEALEAIALNGYLFVKDNFNSEKVAEQFIAKIKNYSRIHND